MNTILLTGAGGFIGRHLLAAVKQKWPGANVLAVSAVQLPGCLNLGPWQQLTAAHLAKTGITSIDAVIHAGAFTPKSAGEANDIERNLSNISFSRNLIAALPNVPAKFIYLSTLDVYATAANPVTEATPEGPRTLYGWSKLFTEKMLEHWAASGGTVLQVLRLGHIYGPGEEQYQKLIPQTIRRIKKGERPVITTSGREKRSFLHVTDCVNAIVQALTLDHYPGPVNVTSAKAYPVLEIVTEIMKLMGCAGEPEVLNQVTQTVDYIFDNTKMVTWLGPETISLREGLKDEIENFKM